MTTDNTATIREDDIIQWLDKKPRGSVLFVALGSEVGPNLDEYAQLATALEESTRRGSG